MWVFIVLQAGCGARPERGAEADALEAVDAEGTSTPVAAETSGSRRILLDPADPAWAEPAPDTFDARFETTAGPFTLRVYRA